MCNGQCSSRLCGDFGRPPREELALRAENVSQRSSVNEFHHYEVSVPLLTPVVNGDDVWVGQVRSVLGFFAEPLHKCFVPGELRVQHLHRDSTVKKLVCCFPHVSHTPAGDVSNEPISV